MPPIVIDIRNAEDARDVVHRAVQALAEGQLDCVADRNGLRPGGQRLPARCGRAAAARSKAGPRASPLALAIKSAEEAPDFVPDMSPLARRLARRCWPGPVTLVVDNEHRDGLDRPVAARSAAGRRAERHDRPARAGQRNVAGRAADAHRPDRAHQRQPQRRGRGRHRRRSRAVPRWRRGAGARRRAVPLRAAVVRRAGQEQSVRNSPRGRRRRSHVAAVGRRHGAVRLHRQHLPQPDGRAADAADAWPSA